MFDRKSDLVRFLALVECRNVVIAARKVGITHQAMSYTLGVLRRRAGAPLFERRAQGLRLTPLGAEAAALARRLLRGLEDGTARLESLRDGRDGRLHVATSAAFLQTVVPAALRAFHQDHPGVDVALRPTGGEVLDLLETGECDLYCGPTAARNVPAKVRRTPLPALTAGLVVAQGHPLQGREPSWHELADYPWIDYGSATPGLTGGPTAVAALHAEVHRRTGRTVRHVLHVDTGDLLLMQTGTYISCLPLDFLDRLPGRFLVPLPGRRGGGTVRTAILTRRSDDALPAVRRLREAVAVAARA